MAATLRFKGLRWYHAEELKAAGMTFWLVVLLAMFIGRPQVVQAAASDVIKEILPLEGVAWIESDGIRAAWLSYKQIDDSMITSLRTARVNTVFLRHGFHDLLDLKTARFEAGVLVVDARDQVLQRLIESTQRASRMGLHVFWLANYELDQMLPHLKRLGYQAAHAEGPGRYLRSGAHLDASPLDSVFWKGLTGAHGELVARCSTEFAIDGLLYDTEHYAGGMMYLQNCGFSDSVFDDFLSSRKLSRTIDSVPAGKRYSYLKNTGQLEDYERYLSESVWEQGRGLAQRWHAINPHLVLGVWPLLDNWFSQGFLRGLSGAVPALGLSGVEYYHGSDQSAAMDSYFRNGNPNLIYLPGFYPPYAYSVEQLRHHAAQAIREIGHYWMLGPHEEIRQTEYQVALMEAYESASREPESEAGDTEVDLDYRVELNSEGPVLVVTANGAHLDRPRLSLFSTFGGAPVCEGSVMSSDGQEGWRVQIPLLRHLTNNRFQSNGYRSGAVYSLSPQALAYRYDDSHHTKLIDGAGYGYFGTTVAWDETIEKAQAVFDLHRDYRVVRVTLAQPRKLEDRHGGPTRLRLLTRSHGGDWSEPKVFQSHFAVSPKGAIDPVPSSKIDPRHNRAWLSWRVDLVGNAARWIKIELEREHQNSSISLGEVVVWAIFEGEVEAQIQQGNSNLKIRNGSRWVVSQ